jgi:hypothetical protein
LLNYHLYISRENKYGSCLTTVNGNPNAHIYWVKDAYYPDRIYIVEDTYSLDFSLRSNDQSIAMLQP